MLNRNLAIPFLVLAMSVPSTVFLAGSDDPIVEKTIVLSDADDDFDIDMEAPEPPETPRAHGRDMVMHIERDGHRGYLGVRLIEMTPELREHFGAPRDAGVFIGGVEKDSPAAKAGIQVGDIVTAADGERIESAHDLSFAMRHKKEGENVKLDLSRDRAKKQITVAVGKLPARELRVGELNPGFHKQIRILRGKDWDGLRMESFPDMGRVQERLDELEKRLKDLEKKLPAR